MHLTNRSIKGLEENGLYGCLNEFGWLLEDQRFVGYMTEELNMMTHHCKQNVKGWPSVGHTPLQQFKRTDMTHYRRCVLFHFKLTPELICVFSVVE